MHTSLSCLSSRIQWFLSFASLFSRLCGLSFPALPVTVWCFEEFGKSFVAALHFPKSMQIETHFFFQSHFLILKDHVSERWSNDCYLASEHVWHHRVRNVQDPLSCEPAWRETDPHSCSSVSFWAPWISIVQLGVVYIVFIAFED